MYYLLLLPDLLSSLYRDKTMAITNRSPSFHLSDYVALYHHYIILLYSLDDTMILTIIHVKWLT